MAVTSSASQGGRERSNYQPSKLPATQRGLPRSCHLWQQPLLCGQHLSYPPAKQPLNEAAFTTLPYAGMDHPPQHKLPASNQGAPSQQSLGTLERQGWGLPVSTLTSAICRESASGITSGLNPSASREHQASCQRVQHSSFESKLGAGIALLPHGQ